MLRALLLTAVCATLVACSSSGGDDSVEPSAANDTTEEVLADQASVPDAADAPATDAPVAEVATTEAPPTLAEASNSSFALAADQSSLALTEGEAPAEVLVTLTSAAGDAADIDLSVSTDSDDLQLALSPVSADGTARLSLQQDIGMAPIVPSAARVTLAAADASGTSAELGIMVNVTPTSLPDVYLLVGQSNMVGFSGPGTQLAEPGQPDAPVPEVLQLNVTGNDQQNFDAAPAFTDDRSIAVKSPRYVAAVDPLHDGFETGIDGKSGTQIGPALSFARQAHEATTAEIILVPAAWSDTGFCARTTNRLDGIGWNAEQPESSAFSGTLLHDRAVARANLALEETGGILRGILWHQGEADADDPICAAAYADNLTALAGSLRTSIIADARGEQARGTGAAVPFIVGTMSRGADERGDYSDFSTSKQMVDDAHRSISAAIPFADFVNNDDLVPPEYPCGEAACVHFGASAYREMGSRYFETLQRIAAP